MLQPEPINTKKNKSNSKAVLKIDMTPLVDLGFLLITFFIFTTTMAEPYKTDLYMPTDGGGTEVEKSNAVTILLSGNDSIFYYFGKLEEAISAKQVRVTNYNVSSGIGAIIRHKQKLLGNKKAEMLLMIKPAETSSYNNLMNALDEVMINNVKKYTLMDISSEEKDFISSTHD